MTTCDFGIRGPVPKETTRKLITLMQFPKNETEKVSGRKCQKYADHSNFQRAFRKSINC